MNFKLATQITLTAAIAFVFVACERGTMRAHGTAPVRKKLPEQKLDECPAADGKWTFGAGGTLDFGRKEGFLTLKQDDLAELVVMDGQSRKIKESSSGLVVDVTGTCKDKQIKISMSQGKITIQQTVDVSIADGTLVLSENDGTGLRQVNGTRQVVEEKAAVAAPEIVR